MTNPDLISSDDAMNFLDCNLMTLSRYTTDYNLTKKKKGRYVFYLKSELRKIAPIVEANKKKTTKASKKAVKKKAGDFEFEVLQDSDLEERVNEICDGLGDKFKEVLISPITNLVVIQHRTLQVQTVLEKNPFDTEMNKLCSSLIKDE